MRRSFRYRGFTLIELLVVITIIVVLLTLLTPALDRAIYQAELAVCGTKQHAAVAAFQTYAIGNQRRYPHRPEVGTGARPAEQIYAHVGHDGTNTWTVDDRPPLKDYLSVNSTFNCPLTEEIEMEDNPDSTDQIYSPQTPWAGYQYVGERGLLKIGDRMIYEGERFNMMISDTLIREIAEDWGRGSHPDKDGAWSQSVLQDASNPWVGAGMTGDAYSTVTYSFWLGGPRGLIDMNFSFQDGSTQRVNDIEWAGDERISLVTNYGDKSTFPTRMVQVPKGN